MHRQRHGFLLFELVLLAGATVVVAVVLLVPALTKARGAARESIDVQSMKQHGLGMAIYAATANDELLAPPRVPRGLDARYGRPGRLAYRFGDEAWPSPSGFGFVEPVVSWTGPGADPAVDNVTPWGTMSMFDAYWLVLSPYMVEGEGLGALYDLFYSSNDEAGISTRGALRDRLRARDGVWWNVAERNQENDAYSPTSFRYVACANVDADFYTRENAGAIRDAWDEEAFYTHARRNSMSRVHFPSQKGMCFMREAFHDEGHELWCEPGVTTVVSMGDGSARAPIVSEATVREEGAFPAGPIADAEVRGGVNKGRSFPGTVWTTLGGIEGRDLRTN